MISLFCCALRFYEALMFVQDCIEKCVFFLFLHPPQSKTKNIMFGPTKKSILTSHAFAHQPHCSLVLMPCTMLLSCSVLQNYTKGPGTVPHTRTKHFEENNQSSCNFGCSFRFTHAKLGFHLKKWERNNPWQQYSLRSPRNLPAEAKQSQRVE